jgi:hypothetical protein
MSTIPGGSIVLEPCRAVPSKRSTSLLPPTTQPTPRRFHKSLPHRHSPPFPLTHPRPATLTDSGYCFPLLHPLTYTKLAAV